MPTYEYECTACNVRFEQEQSMADAPLKRCPWCGGEVRRLVSGGTGFIFRGEGKSPARSGSCSLETTGRTCCGKDERCGEPRCGE
jgi:putative FmdB family regulatory protein